MGVRATTDDDAMSSTLGKNCMCTCLMRLSFELTRGIYGATSSTSVGRRYCHCDFVS